MLLVDSHCHLNFPDFKDDIDDVITRAREVGVQYMQTICTEMAEYEEIAAIADKYDGIFCSVGVHPNDSANAELVSVEELVEKSQHKKTIGLGETGLDYYYERADRELQQNSFLNHIEASRQTNLPLIVHTRDADDDTINILTDEYKKGPFRGLIHCFTSTERLAMAALDIGFSISISGIATFKSAQSIRNVVEKVPIDKLLIETDAPFLAPTPNRGKRNEPSFVQYTNKIVAELKNISEKECANITTENFFTLFDKADRGDIPACA